MHGGRGVGFVARWQRLVDRLRGGRRMTTSPLANGAQGLASRLADRWPEITTALLIATLGVAPVALLPADGPVYVGIATATPTFYTYTGAVILAAGLLAFRARQHLLRGLVPWIPVAVWLMVLTLLAWDGSPRLYSGLLHLVLGMAAFAIGATAGRLGRVATLVPWAFAAVAWIQLAAIVLAKAGLPLRTISGSPADEVHGRAIGLTTHPGEISKLLFFCAMCALLLPQRTTGQRWAAWLTLAATLLGVSLTQSRAPLIGLVALIATFTAVEFAAGRWQRRHIAVVGMTVVLALASVPWMIRRFSVDPGMETRRHAMAVALDVIAAHPGAGVGVNNYVAVAGVWDRLTAEGVPVHNILLLSAAELGILGALLLWLPFALVAVRAARTLRRSRGSDTAARILVSALPGIGIIALTGWGLLQGPYFLLFGFVFGYFGARADPRATGRDPDGGD